ERNVRRLVSVATSVDQKRPSLGGGRTRVRAGHGSHGRPPSLGKTQSVSPVSLQPADPSSCLPRIESASRHHAIIALGAQPRIPSVLGFQPVWPSPARAAYA